MLKKTPLVSDVDIFKLIAPTQPALITPDEIQFYLAQQDIAIDAARAAWLADPPPLWLKILEQGEFRVRYVNETYVRLFLQPRGYTAEDYYCMTDAEMWGEETGEQFQKNDWEVFKTGKKTEVRENVPALCGPPIVWRLTKKALYPMGLPGLPPVGVWGYGVECLDCPGGAEVKKFG